MYLSENRILSIDRACNRWQRRLNFMEHVMELYCHSYQILWVICLSLESKDINDFQNRMFKELKKDKGLCFPQVEQLCNWLSLLYLFIKEKK